MRSGNETPNANSAHGRRLVRIIEVYPKLPKCIQNCQSLPRMAKLVCAAVMKHLTLALPWAEV